VKKVIRVAYAAVPGNDRKACLEQWIAQYGDIILRMCFVYLADMSMAEDAMQDTFLKAWNSMAQFEERNNSTAKTWLTRIAINICHDYHRSRWFRHVDRSKVLKEISADRIDVVPQERALFLSLLYLPTKLKQTVLLYYYQGMTLQEIADCLSISVSAVHQRLQKAQALLKTSLEKEGLQ
jgi:RNA polymerase sigma-70 factor, ECF subfamily